MNSETKLDREMQMFGMSLEAVEKQFEAEIGNKMVYDRLHYAACILSDAQEEMANGSVEVARKFINKAKYHMSVAREKVGRNK